MRLLHQLRLLAVQSGQSDSGGRIRRGTCAGRVRRLVDESIEVVLLVLDSGRLLDADKVIDKLLLLLLLRVKAGLLLVVLLLLAVVVKGRRVRLLYHLDGPQRNVASCRQLASTG